ncbi:MAG: polyprenyl synthetase family protein [Actinobacteria bacterium]|nr:polyprenyl synthetase family protein [Actinomycetota bacterium]
MNINEIIFPVKEELDEFENTFVNFLHSNVPLVEQIVQYISTKRGKRLRPMLVFMAAKLHGEITAKTLSASIVIEMLHTATLIHDDVVDESAQRRGSPTVNNVWSNKISILVGDFLFSKTLAGMLDLRDIEALAIISEAAKLITEGELLQIAHDQDFAMDESIYFDLVSRKTAALFSAACELGALTTGANGESREKMKEFGENLGIAFQIKDDLLDYIGIEEELGKPTGNDIREKKVTLPLIFALSHSSLENRNAILVKLDKGVQGEEEIADVVRFVRENGGIDYSMDTANNYGQKAIKILEEYSNSELTPYLKELVIFAINREK